MAGTHLAKRIPRIKFPQRHPSPAVSGSSAPKSQEQVPSFYDDLNAKLLSWTRVPSPPENTAVGGKASLLPERRPLSEKEMEIILLGGAS
ncbi:hypothetical protein EJ110_NYTH45952 [Nymphaea thermarum]|nr:hypothetical protein EJ110_NYTH45952 [Nymphaea thermarum]